MSRLVKHSCAYRVDSEVGRFTFETYDVVDWEGQVIFEGRKLFPALISRQWYQTQGMRRWSILFGTTNQSYRKITELINRQRRQVKDGTPLRTLQDSSEREGAKVQQF